MGIWQIIMVALYALSLGLYLANHGKPKEGKYSFWTALFSTGLQIFILYMGGFFG